MTSNKALHRTAHKAPPVTADVRLRRRNEKGLHVAVPDARRLRIRPRLLR